MAAMTEAEMMAALALVSDSDSDSDDEVSTSGPTLGPGEEKKQESESEDEGEQGDDGIDPNFCQTDAEGEGIRMTDGFFDVLHEGATPGLRTASQQLMPNTEGVVYPNPKIAKHMLDAVTDMNFDYVSKTQYTTLPPILQMYDPAKPAHEQITGNNVIMQGPAGTGKTMAFTLGTMVQIDASLKAPQVIVIGNVQELAEQNQTQADFFSWRSIKAEGNEITFLDSNDARIDKDDPDWKQKRQSRFGPDPNKHIETCKLVGSMKTPWKEQVSRGISAQYVSMTEGVLYDMLKKKRGQFDPAAKKFFENVRMVVIDEADEIWSKGGIGKLKTEFVLPLCQIRNTGFKQTTPEEKSRRKKTQFICVSATFRENDRPPLRKLCADLKEESYCADLKEVYLNHRALLLKKVRQFHIRCTNYEQQMQALIKLCKTIQPVSKSVLIIPIGEEGGGQLKQMDEIYAHLKPHFPENAVDTFSATTSIPFADKRRPTRKGRYKYTDLERTQLMSKFQNQSIKYMIATTMNRGINIPNLTHVIMFGMATRTYSDTPVHDEYLQRVGRCGRAGKSGCSIVLWNQEKEMSGTTSRGDSCGMKYVQEQLDMGDASKGTQEIVIARAPSLNSTLNGPPSGVVVRPITPVIAAGATEEEVKEWWKKTFTVRHK